MPRLLRQCYLGSSPQRTLCLVSSDSSTRCHVSMLPDELLADILAYLPPESNSILIPIHELYPPIPLVCKHWARVYDATLYQSVSFVENTVGKGCHASNILETLRRHPDLRKLVRNISVRLWIPSEAKCRGIADTIKSFQATRTVSLHLVWSTDAWPIIEAVKMLPHLESLQLSGIHTGPSLQMILKHFSQPNIKKIQLFGHGIGKRDSLREAMIFPRETVSQDDLDELSILARSHSSAIKSLELCHRIVRLATRILFSNGPQSL